ncbi:GIY-YIG nuclease family protein [Oceanicaulis sp.]|uniref:GIY-YIG nuclease family protein n=1 Tax=Oceanicaulis sp. TaxID=1924941 RepID=UPI003D2D2ED7
MKQFAVYILTNRPRGVLYTGVTSDLVGRIWQHREGVVEGFSTRYDIKQLVWFETHSDAEAAIMQEQRIKRWRRDWKLDLIETANSGWKDLWPEISR